MLKTIKSIGVAPGDSLEIRLRKFTIVIIALCCCMAAPVWSLIYYLMGLYIPALGPVLFFAVVVPALVYLIVSKNEKPLINAQIFFIMLCPSFMQWTSGGFVNGGAVILWSFLAPLSALLFMEMTKAVWWMILFSVNIIITILFDRFFQQFSYEITGTERVILIGMNLLGPSVAVFFAMRYFVKTILKNSAALKEEKQKSDKLLLNILPEEVAGELKSKGSADAKLFDHVTVLFTDFVNFTTVSERLSPQQLVDELNTCFKAFDEILSEYNIEKIKTVGDAYLAVAGLPSANASHAEVVVCAALEIRDFMQNRKSLVGNSTFEIRIGIHSGNVVAGIVGVKKFAYDIWGDTVNIAARMEQSSEAGKVNISESTYLLILDKFSCEFRGEIEAKNKGLLKMYFVNEAKSPVLSLPLVHSKMTIV